MAQLFSLGHMSAPLISDALPELAQELETLLVKDGEPELAAQDKLADKSDGQPPSP